MYVIIIQSYTKFMYVRIIWKKIKLYWYVNIMTKHPVYGDIKYLHINDV